MHHVGRELEQGRGHGGRDRQPHRRQNSVQVGSASEILYPSRPTGEQQVGLRAGAGERQGVGQARPVEGMFGALAAAVDWNGNDQGDPESTHLVAIDRCPKGVYGAKGAWV